MSEKDKEFIRGFACAVSLVGSRWMNMHTAAQDMIGEGGFTKQDLIDAGVEQSDIEAIYGDD